MHVNTKKLTKILKHCVPTFSIAYKHKTVCSDIGYRVTAASTSRSCLNLLSPRFFFGGGNRKSLGNELPLHNHSQSRLFIYETVRQVDLFPERSSYCKIKYARKLRKIMRVMWEWTSSKQHMMAATPGVATQRSALKDRATLLLPLSRPIYPDLVVIQHSLVTFYHGPPTRQIMSWQLETGS
jgi:hypothetical protein